jgi:hypothetical protein
VSSQRVAYQLESLDPLDLSPSADAQNLAKWWTRACQAEKFFNWVSGIDLETQMIAPGTSVDIPWLVLVGTFRSQVIDFFPAEAGFKEYLFGVLSKTGCNDSWFGWGSAHLDRVSNDADRTVFRMLNLDYVPVDEVGFVANHLVVGLHSSIALAPASKSFIPFVGSSSRKYFIDDVSQSVQIFLL